MRCRYVYMIVLALSQSLVLVNSHEHSIIVNSKHSRNKEGFSSLLKTNGALIRIYKQVFFLYIFKYQRKRQREKEREGGRQRERERIPI